VCLAMADLRKLASHGYGDPSFYYSKYKSYYSDEPAFNNVERVNPELKKTA